MCLLGWKKCIRLLNLLEVSYFLVPPKGRHFWDVEQKYRSLNTLYIKVPGWAANVYQTLQTKGSCPHLYQSKRHRWKFPWRNARKYFVLTLTMHAFQGHSSVNMRPVKNKVKLKAYLSDLDSFSTTTLILLLQCLANQTWREGAKPDEKESLSCTNM